MNNVSTRRLTQERVIDLVERSGADFGHAVRVARFARRVFDATTQLHGLVSSDALLLETAALVHEIGQQLSYESRYEMSAYIIRNSRIAGLSPEQTSLVARVARGCGKLSAEEEAVESLAVLKLGAILRLADALDRTHSGVVCDVDAEAGCELVVLTVHALEEPRVEIETALRKSKPFAKHLGREVAFHFVPWVDPVVAGSSPRAKAARTSRFTVPEERTEFANARATC